MTGARCRLVITTFRNGEEKERWVSSPFADCESSVEVAKEAFLHALGEWDVKFVDSKAICTKGETRREISVMRFQAMADVVSAGIQERP